jgi:hypothetical protein
LIGGARPPEIASTSPSACAASVSGASGGSSLVGVPSAVRLRRGALPPQIGTYESLLCP